MRSLQRALYKDEADRRITEIMSGPLFVDCTTETDEASGTTYVLRSHSTLPFVVENRYLLHKIGVTNSKVEQRIRTLQLDSTLPMAEVEIVARIFESARVELEVEDRFGRPVTPRVWFLVPLSAIDQAVMKIEGSTITRYFYNPQEASLKCLV